MANAILNFHFDYLHTSLNINNYNFHYLCPGSATRVGLLFPWPMFDSAVSVVPRDSRHEERTRAKEIRDLQLTSNINKSKRFEGLTLNSTIQAERLQA